MHILTILAAVIGTLIAGASAPSEKELTGKWGCTGSEYVFMEKEGATPDKSVVDIHVKGMGATKSNCVLTFSEGHKLNFRVGEKSFDMTWSLNPEAKEFSTKIGFFTLKGYMMKKGDRLLLVYSRSNLFLIMKFLCSSEGKKHIPPLGDLLDCCKGLTLGMYFSK